MMDNLIPFDRLEMVAKSLAPYPVDFDDAWQWVGYSTKQHAKDSLEKNFVEGSDFTTARRGKDGNLIVTNNRDNQVGGKDGNLNSRNKPENQVAGHGGKREGAGRPSDIYLLTTDCFKAFCMMAGTPKGKEVRRYYLDLEKKYLSLVQEARLSKLVRRDFTDIIQASGLNATMHGFAFKQFTDLINKAVLGMEARKYREINKLPKDANIREHVTPVQRASIAKIERLVGAAIEVGADYYKVKAMIADMGMGKIEAAGSEGAA
jgi:hypothetical protein